MPMNLTSRKGLKFCYQGQDILHKKHATLNKKIKYFDEFLKYLFSLDFNVKTWVKQNSTSWEDRIRKIDSTKWNGSVIIRFQS